LTCADAKKIHLVDYLASLGYHPQKASRPLGYGGKVASNSNNYLQMANLCRKLEIKHQLKQMLNPRSFLPKEQRLIPRQTVKDFIRPYGVI
jgi:hypothetical protein